jgi:hypothetical protein
MLQQSVFCSIALLQCSTPSGDTMHHAVRCARAHLVCNADHCPVSNFSTSHTAKARPSSCPLMITCAHTTCTMQHTTRNRQRATCMQHADKAFTRVGSCALLGTARASPVVQMWQGHAPVTVQIRRSMRASCAPPRSQSPPAQRSRCSPGPQPRRAS